MLVDTSLLLVSCWRWKQLPYFFKYHWCLTAVNRLHAPKDYNIKMYVTYASQCGDMRIFNSAQSLCCLYLPPNPATIMQCHPCGTSERVSNAVLYGHIWNRHVNVILVPAVHDEVSVTEFRAKFFICAQKIQLTKKNVQAYRVRS